MQHLEGSGTPVLYIQDAWFLKVKYIIYHNKCGGYYKLPYVDCVFSQVVRSFRTEGGSYRDLRFFYSCMDRYILRLLLDWCNVAVVWFRPVKTCTVNLLKPTGHYIYHQFNIKKLYALPTLYLCVLYLSENKQRLVPLTA